VSGAIAGAKSMEDAKMGWIAAIILGGIAGWLAQPARKSRH
jgi:hypothetical protein